MKDDDGNDIKLIVLKTPIPLENLECEYENDSKDLKRNKVTKDRTNENSTEREEIDDKVTETKNEGKKISAIERDEMNTGDDVKHEKTSTITLLKEPVSLDTWNNETLTINVKTVQGTQKNVVTKTKTKLDAQIWKENALAIFEFSYVYPFIHSANKYRCFLCPNNFLEAVGLKDHTINEHSINELKKELNNVVGDRDLKVDVSCLQCRICYEVLPNLQTLKTHLRDHGKKIDPNFKDNIIPYKLHADNFECQVCGERYRKLRMLIIHMSKHFNNYSCEICGTVFVSLILLRKHQKSHETGNFPCDKCDKVFTNSTKRTLHMKGVHLKRLPRRCPICPERFNSYYQRTKHMRVVHNQSSGLFRCETCGKEYDIKYHLLIHVRSVHLQERNQECTVCHARFFSKYCLTRHMVIHTGEKNFKCELCGKAYVRRKNLREHSRTHEMERAVCNVCGINCDDQPALVAHTNAVHGVL